MMFLHKAKNNLGKVNYVSFIIYFFLFAYMASAQTDTLSLRYAAPGYPYFNSFSETGNSDTTLNNIQNSFSGNILGNIGLPSYNLVQSLSNDPLGTRYYKLPFQNDLFKNTDPVYYFSSPLYTQIYASAGQVKEQALKLIHSQLINKKVNVTLKFNRYSSTGFYSKQLSYVNNLMLSSHYTTNNGRWGYLSHFLFNKIKFQENGGISTDSLFKENIFINKQLLPVKLQNARRNIRTSEISFTQFFRLNKNADSTRNFNHYIYHTSTYENNFYQYIEPSITKGFYKHFYIDSTKTNDSTHLMKIANEARYVLKQKNEKILFYAGFKNEFTQMHLQTKNRTYNNDFALIGAYWQNKNSNFTLNSENEYIFKGINLGDYRINLWSTINTNFKHLQLHTQLIAENRNQDLLFRYNESNNFNWANNFNKIQSNQAEVKIHFRDWKFFIEGTIKSLTNAVYFNNDALPVQYNNKVNVTRLTLGKELALFKVIHFNNTINYQLISDTTFIKIPSLVSFHQLYYQGNLYKKNLQLQIGFQCTYISAYTGNAYMPATNVFYTQNTQQLGNYPYVDFFMNAQIKPVRFFVKLSHLNQGFSGFNYNLVSGYYQADRAIKFGLIWLFWD